MATVRRLVIDVLKPHDPDLLEFTEQIAEIESIAGVTSSLIELDKEVQNIELTLSGDDVDYETVVETIEHLGGTIHSVDEVVCGDHIVPDRHVGQEPA
jgi:hypothetical protein